MKKHIALWVLILFLANLIPFPVVATSPIPSVTSECIYDTKEEIRALAASVFPEYAEDISTNKAPQVNQLATYSLTNKNLELEICESKSVSDNMLLTYYQYSNGVDMLALTDTTVVVDDTWTYDNISEGTIGTYYKVDIRLDCNVAEAPLLIADIEYRLVDTDYDFIIDPGTIIGDVAGDAVGYITGQELTETASRKAYVEYSTIFDVSGIYELTGDADYINVTAILRVGSNRANLELYMLPDSI